MSLTFFWQLVNFSVMDRQGLVSQQKSVEDLAAALIAIAGVLALNFELDEAGALGDGADPDVLVGFAAVDVGEFIPGVGDNLFAIFVIATTLSGNMPGIPASLVNLINDVSKSTTLEMFALQKP